MRIRIDTPLRTSHIRATAVLSKTQRAYSECETGETGRPVPKLFSPTIHSATGIHQVALNLANSPWTMRSTRSLKAVAARVVRCPLAERSYSSRRAVTRTPGGFFRTTRGTLGSVLSPTPDGHPSGHSACANWCNCSQHLKSGSPQRD